MLATVGTNFVKNEPWMPKRWPCITERRIKRRIIYPRPSFEGNAPSPIAKLTARIWSAITLNETSKSFEVLYFLPALNCSNCWIIGMNKSVSKFVGVSWITETTRSNPIPVSTFLCGNGGYVPSGIWLNWENTKFQISK